jgi:hypothetical protein
MEVRGIIGRMKKRVSMKFCKRGRSTKTEDGHVSLETS